MKMTISLRSRESVGSRDTNRDVQIEISDMTTADVEAAIRALAIDATADNIQVDFDPVRTPARVVGAIRSSLTPFDHSTEGGI